MPVAANGTFQILTQNSTHIIVDVMGYMAGGSALVPAGFNGQITGYGPGFSITPISGDVTNGTGVAVDIRADVHLPNGTVEVNPGPGRASILVGEKATPPVSSNPGRLAPVVRFPRYCSEAPATR